MVETDAIRESAMKPFVRALSPKSWSCRSGAIGLETKGGGRDLLYRRELTKRGRRGMRFNAYEAKFQLSNA
jgi:hypothetical protein